MSEFGQGFGLPWLVLRGLPLQEQLPKTPQGYGDDTQKLFSDTMLLGGMFLAGLKPIAYSYENFSRFTRNVAPSKLEVDSVSSHGSKRDLHWHTDNAYAFEEGYRSARSTGSYLLRVGSPSPRFLCFVGLRLNDGQGQAVPTELLLFDNYRVLHRRKSFDPGSWDEARWLRRCFGTTDPSGGQFVDRLHRPYVWQ